MDIKESLEEFRVIFSIPLPESLSFSFLGQRVTSIDINETVVISWLVMAILIGASLLLTRKLQTVPRGPQVFLEWAVEFCNNFAREHFGHRASTFGPYIGTIFLFLLVANIIPVISPLAIPLFAIESPFKIRPPTRDINLTAALALLSILIVLISGIRARGFGGWCKNLLTPVPMMLPFNLLDFITRPVSLCLRLFGNILGGMIIMLLVETALPIPLGVPVALSLYFDFFDGLIQAAVFTFLTTLFIAEAVEVKE
ncbi:ATP synthase subunit a [Spirochaetia bacterium]|nr:ATP synthase subunit a [Spirochaetia bacterium]GHU32239.1 ATP synthase subunit a [Spirochaetia bacterium]